MMTLTDRRRFPILLAVIAALAMAMLFSPVQAQGVSAPDQPSGLEATATHEQVTLTWDDPQDDSITGYVILRRVRMNDTGGDFDVLVADTASAATTYTDTTVAAGLIYTYRIKAINEHGVSERSRWSHIDVPAAPQSKSEYIDAHNERERALEELLAQTDPLNPDAGETEEEDDEREAGKQGKSVGTQQGKSSHTVDICGRTPEVEAALLAFIQANESSVTCSTVTDAQLASVDYLNVLDGYSSPSIVPSDFAGLTGLVELQVAYSQQLTTVPANAFRELRSTTVLGYIGLSGNQIKTVHPDAFDGLNFSTVRKQIPGIAFNGNVIETLPASVFDDVTGLKSIDLNYNHITGFEDGVFAGLNELKRLYLSRNHIKVLPDDLFEGLTALESLYLSFNDLTALEADTFADLSNLETLDISRGQIASLDADSFKGLTSLETLDLQRNAIPALPAAVFDDLDNLSVLRLTLNDISSLNANTLSGLTNLTELYLGGNNLASLPGDSFQNLISLTTLDLQANDLTSVDEGLFSGLADLEVLRLDGNQLSALPENLFDPLDDNLTLLYLHANVLTALPEDIFDGLEGLGRLALDDNQLTTLPADIFDPLDDDLVFLWLGDNSFSSLPADLFDGLQPGYLWIPAAGLTALDADLFEPLGSNLILLDLSNNDLTSLDASVFDDLTGIVFLYLHGNELTSLPADVFDGLGALGRLYLDGNELTSLPADVFDGLGALGRLRLDENDLTTLPANLFEDLDESLTDLYLRDNGLTALPSGVFSGLGGLQRLDLSCNALTTLDLEVFNPFAGSLKYLDLGANSLITPPTEAAVNAKLTELDALYLTGDEPCLPAYDVGLSALSLSTGTLNTAFVPPGRSQYQATVGHDVSQLTITATTRNPDAVIGPSPGGDIVNDEDPNTPGIQATLNPISTSVRWQVTAKNRDSSLNKNYTVLVIREHPPGSVARLRSLEVSGLTLSPEFGSTTYDYEAEGPESTTQTSVTAIPIDPDAEVAITVDGVTAGADGTVDILPDSRTVTVEVTAEDGMTTQTYTVSLLQPSADASLSSLSLSGITLDPEFSTKATSYTASVESTVTSTTVTAETTDEDATAAIMINDQEDADGTVDLVAGYNDITVVVTAQDGTTTQSYTVTVLRAAPEDASTSDSKTITSLLSRLDAELRDTVINSYHNQTVGYDPANSQGSLSPAWFNYPAGFSPSYTVERLIVGQEGAVGDIAATGVVLRVRGTVVSTSGTKAPVLPADADITLHLEGDNFTRSYSLNNPESRTDSGCFVENDPNNSERPCKVGELGKSLYAWRTNLPPLLADGESILVRLRYTAPRPGTPGRPLVTAPEGKSGALVVNWIAPASNDPKVRGYEIQVSPAPGETRASGVTKTTGASTTRLPVLLLEPNTAYDVRVRVRTNLTTGPWSGTARARTNPLQGTNMPQVTLDLNGITRVKEGDGLPKRLKVTGMPNLHLGAFPEVLDGYDQSNFVEFRVLEGIADSFTYADHPGGGSVGAFYAGALTIGEDGEVYHDKGYLVIPEGMSAYGPLYIWLGRAGTSPEDGSTVVNTGKVNIGSTDRQCVEIADSSNSVPTGRTCPSGGISGHAVDRLTARFVGVPRSHDGESEFTLRVAFIKDVGISPSSLREDALTVTGGTVTQAQRVDDRSDLFEITVEPASDEDVTITLVAGSDCAVAGAICTEGEDPKKLYNSPTVTVSGPTLTASFQGLPSQHDGETAFSFRIAFNDDIATGEEEFRDHSVEVWGGRVTRAQPVDQRRDLWEVEVEPASDDLVMVSLRPSLSCDETGAVCTAGGRRLSVSPATMVAGPATWPVQVNGEAQVGKTLTADTSNISDRFGVQVTSMTYQWLANNARIRGASGQSYTLGEGNRGRKISVMATFTDDRGNEDTLTSAPTEPVAARERNNRATGLPLISGRALVGQTLTADTSLIFDADGLENSVLSYLWEADDDSIPGANDPTYTPVQADVGKVITVIVSFLDDAGYGQSMTSPDTMAVTTAEAAAKVGFAHSLRYAANADGSVSLYWNAPDDEATGYRILRRRSSMGEPKLLVYVADTGSTATAYTDTEVTAGVPHNYRVQVISYSALGERSDLVKVFPLRKAANSPATGAPAISGVAQVGETLTADTSGIVDADGLENVTQNYLWGINKGLIIGAVYGYQWLADEAEIEDATGSTYILADVDEGKAIKVRVSFTDDGGHRETLTSAATAAVAQPNAPATGLPTVSGKAWVGETLTVDTSGISDENGLDDATFTHLWITDDSVVVSTGTRAYTPTGGDQGKAVMVRVSFSDDAGNWETRTSAQTATVAARANSPGICDRTEQVRDDIIGLLNAQDLGSLGIKDCSEVTEEYLTRIRFLDLAGGGTGEKITSLKSGDFEGLSGMSELNLEDNSLSELPEGVFDGLSSLAILTMQGNDLGSLPDGVFDDLTNLDALALYDNDLAALPDGIFEQLTELSTLAISDNKLTALSGDVFTGLAGLTHLVASNNKLTSLPDGVFSGMPKLQTVNLSGNPGAPFTLRADLEQEDAGGVVVKVAEGAPFAMTVTLSAEGGTLSATTVVIDGGDTESAVLTVTPEGAGAVTVSVDSAAFPDAGTSHEGIQAGVGESLTLEAAASGICDRTAQVRDAILEMLPDTSDCALVTDIDLGGITRLRLKEKGITTLKSGDFSGLSNLQFLHLADNELRALPDGIFDKLTSLQILYLYSNRLSELPVGIFDKLTSLQILYLYSNRLSELPVGIFDNLTELQSLDLSRNRVSELPVGIFDNLTELQSLYLHSNRLSELPDGIFDNTNRLQRLQLHYNKLSELPVGIFDNLASLKSLPLGGNQLGELPNGVFDKLTRLQSLGLGVNRLSELPDGIFDELTNLEWIGLNGNELSALPDGIFDELTSLEGISLNGNELSALPEGIFGNLTGLGMLHLYSNNLSELPDDTFLGLTNLYAVDFRLNTGSPFILTAELEQAGENTIALKVSQAAPLDMEVTLAAEGGGLSSTAVVIAAGSGSSAPVTVTPDGDGPVTIRVISANFQLPTDVRTAGIRTGLGDPLTLEQVSNTNTLATGLPTISGTAQVGETLTADTSDIEDANGLANATFSYRWVSSDGTTDTDIEKATDSTYKLVADDAGKSIKVIVTFADDAGNEETLTSAPTAPVWGDGPPGAPGNLTVTAGDQEITLSWEPPADNGNAPATRYRIEWRIDGKDYKKGHWGPSGETTYTKTDLANGVKYIFRVKAENGNGNSYGPYGPASEEVSATPTSGLTVDLGTPVLSNTKTLHHGMVKLDWEDVEDAGWYVVQYYHVKGGEWLDLPTAEVDIAFHGSSAVVSNLHGLSWLRVRAMSCAGESEWSQIEELYGTNASDWEGVPVPEVEEGDEIDPCPVVLGTPVLSNMETLHHGMVRLDWEDIEDAGWYVVQYYHVKGGEWLDLPAEGVDVAFHGSSAVVSNLHGLSWLRVRAMSCAGASEWSQIEELYGTNASDWKGVPVPEVAEGDEIEPCSEDGDTTDNSPATGAPTISGTAQVGETLTANTSGVIDADGLSNAAFTYQWLADDADISGATNATYTLVTEDEGKAIKVQVSFTDDAGHNETLTSAATDAVDARPNSRAAGVPTISGTAQVGETLSADKSGIADADGLTNATFSYQWLADAAEIAGATGSTYTLSADDEGRTVKVQVSFTDDAGNEETLTSVATEAVAAAPTPNSPATGLPTINGTAQVGETLTANTSGVADADGLSRVQYEYQWLADDSDISGATNATYTLTDSEESKTVKVQVSFTDDAGHNETLTSAATDAVAGAQPTEPPTKPRNLSATASHDSVTLTWTNPNDDSITGYVILRRIPGVDPEGQFRELVSDTGTAATTYTDDTVSAETRYTYRIKAINGAGTSERSRWVHIDTPAAPVPDKPTGLFATASHDSVTLTWDDPGDDSITGYVILRRVRENNTGGDFTVLVADTGTAATTYTDDTVAAGTTYTYRIKAINEYGTSERSRWFHIDIPAAP